MNFCKISAWHCCWRLVVDPHLDQHLEITGLETRSNLESGGTPVDKVDNSCHLDRHYCRVYILWHNIASVEQADCHVLASKEKGDGLHF